MADPEKFTFSYKLRDDTYELYDEQQILYPSQWEEEGVGGGGRREGIGNRK